MRGLAFKKNIITQEAFWKFQKCRVKEPIIHWPVMCELNMSLAIHSMADGNSLLLNQLLSPGSHLCNHRLETQQKVSGCYSDQHWEQRHQRGWAKHAALHSDCTLLLMRQCWKKSLDIFIQTKTIKKYYYFKLVLGDSMKRFTGSTFAYLQLCAAVVCPVKLKVKQ